MIELEGLINLFVENGVTVVLLGWFMFRVEKKLDALTDAMKEFCIEMAKK